MKKFLVLVLLALFVGGSSHALRPDGWFWNDGEWEWADEGQYWYWIPPGPPFLQNTNTAQNVPRPVNGWLYYDWPYFYALNDATWYFIYQGNLPFVFKPSAIPENQWTLWGTPIEPGPTPDPGPMPTLVAVNGGTIVLPEVGEVTVAPFQIGESEITAEQWLTVREWALQNGYDFGDGFYCEEGGGAATNPITSVSWYDAAKFCNALSEKDGLEPAYYSSIEDGEVYRTGIVDLSLSQVNEEANGYRLPTEAEWFFAAATDPSGNEEDFLYSGGDVIGDLAWYSGNSDLGPCSWLAGGRAAQEIKTKQPNSRGMYDVTGNVSEWAFDAGASNSRRLLKGGYFFWDPEFCEIAYRFETAASLSASGTGLRVARSGLPVQP